MAAHLGDSVPLVLLLPFAGAVTAVVAVAVGLPGPAGPRPLPGRLHPRLRPVDAGVGAGHAVLDRPAHRQAGVHRPAQPGLHLDRPARRSSGSASTPQRAFAWFSLGVLVRLGAHGPGLAGPRHRPPAGAVRDNELTAGGDGHPGGADQAAGLRPLGVHGRLRRGVPGLRQTSASAPPPSTPTCLDPGRLDGGDRRARLDPRRGARRLYLVGLPAIFGTTSTIQFLTSGFGLSSSSSTCPVGWPRSCTGWATWPPTVCAGCSTARRPVRAPGPAPARGASTGAWRRWPSSAEPAPARPGRRCERGTPSTGPARPLEVEDLVVDLRRRARRRPREPDRRARLDRGAHRPQRLGEDHDPRRHLGQRPPPCGVGAGRRRGGDRLSARGAHRRRRGPILPGLPALPRVVGRGHADGLRGRPPAGQRGLLHPSVPRGLGAPSAESTRLSTG